MVSAIFITLLAAISTAIAAPGGISAIWDKRDSKDCTTLCATSTLYNEDCETSICTRTRGHEQGCSETPCVTGFPDDQDCSTSSVCAIKSTYNPAFTTCSTSLCTSSSIFAVPTTIYETSTIYIPITSYRKANVTETKTLTSQRTKTVTTYTPSTITSTTWLPHTTESVIDVPYTTALTEWTEAPYITSSPSVSICEITSEHRRTTAWVDTETICRTLYSQGERGNSHSAHEDR
jgi:hypothetical protein